MPLTASRPKCLLNIRRRSLLAWQLLQLAAGGVRDAIVVTGHEGHKVEAALAMNRLPGLRTSTVRNPGYADSENITSCWAARHEMTGEFVLLNGDTLFEPKVLALVRNAAPASITVAIDRKPLYDADDMKVSTAQGRITGISKAMPADAVDGEAIGMILFRNDGGHQFREAMSAILRQGGRQAYYLAAIDRLARDGAVAFASVQGCLWCEVDTPADLIRARALLAGWNRACEADPPHRGPASMAAHDPFRADRGRAGRRRHTAATFPK